MLFISETARKLSGQVNLKCRGSQICSGITLLRTSENRKNNIQAVEKKEYSKRMLNINCGNFF